MEDLPNKDHVLQLPIICEVDSILAVEFGHSRVVVRPALRHHPAHLELKGEIRRVLELI